jgi:hypothetical protein
MTIIFSVNLCSVLSEALLSGIYSISTCSGYAQIFVVVSR